MRDRERNKGRMNREKEREDWGVGWHKGDNPGHDTVYNGVLKWSTEMYFHTILCLPHFKSQQ